MCITVLSLVMSITMLSSVSAKEASIEYQGLWTDYAAKEYDAGDGTKESPYLIKDASQLALLAKNVNEKEEKDKYYELISDIDLSGHFWNPVGYVKRKLNFFSGGNYFYGVFEGNNHTIKNLNIIQNNPNDDNYYYGLFAWNSGTIQNLNVINANIDCDGVSYIGGIASVNVGDINQCSFEGSISVSNDAGDIAGIVGRQEDGGTVNHCKNKAQIKATTQDCNYLGGIVGYNEYGCIRDCVNEGDNMSSWMFDFARPQVDSIYGMKEGESPWLLAALLLLLIGPAEEIFWRGYVQRTLSKRWNPNAGFVVATLIYALVHAGSCNFMLVMAALVEIGRASCRERV